MVSNKFILLRERKDRLQFFAIKNNQIDRYFFEPFSPVFQIDDPDKTIKYDLSSGRSFDWNIGQSALGARTLQPSPPAGENSAVHVPNGLLRCINVCVLGHIPDVPACPTECLLSRAKPTCGRTHHARIYETPLSRRLLRRYAA
jgi:hypothetical protein